MDSTTVQFFRELFGEHFEGRLLAWNRGTRRSLWFGGDALEEAAKVFTAKATGNSDWYFGCCLRGHDHGPGRRGSAEDCTAAGGLWADCDYRSEGHQRQYAPKDQVLHVLRHECPIRPSVILDTGGGFHAHWLLEELWRFGCVDERLKFSRLNKQFQDVLRGLVGEMDATADLPRILRPAGAWSTKQGRYVEVVEAEWYRYTVGEIEEHIDSPLESSAPLGISHERIQITLANDPELRNVWELRRKMPSPSEYDMSIATRLVGHGYTDAEITQAVYTFRSMHGFKTDKVTDRTDYIRSLLRKARGDSGVAAQRILASEPKEGEKAADDTREDLTLLFDLPNPLSRVLMTGTEEPVYSMEMEDGERIALGTLSEWTKGKELETKIGDFVGKIAKGMPMKAPARTRIYNSILSLRERDSVDTSLGGIIEEAIGHVVKEVNWRETERTNLLLKSAVFIEGGELYFQYSHLIPVFRRQLGVKVSRQQIAAALRVLGARYEKIQFRGPHGNSTRQYWVYPLGDFS